MDVDLSVPLILGGMCNKNFYIEESECLPKQILNEPNGYISCAHKLLKSGVDIICAPTALATSEHLRHFELDEETEQINFELVKLAKSVSDDVKIAGVISQADLDIEPFGEILYTQLMHIYRKQASALIQAGVDILLLDMKTISHARAAVLALQKFDMPIFVMMHINADSEMDNDESPISALLILQKLGIAAFGIYENSPKNDFSMLKKEIVIYSQIPLIIHHQREAKTYKITDEFIGYNPNTQVGEIMLADKNQVYNLYFDSIEGSQQIECSVDMTDIFLELEDESFDVIMIEINSVDDAKDFSNNAHLSELPFCLCSHDEISLRLALMLYNGIAMISSDTSIPDESLSEIAEKYGAVIY